MSLALLFAATLSACGGGSGGGSTDTPPPVASTPSDPAPTQPSPPPPPPPPPPNSALLSWDTPATRADGTDNPTVAGYRVYYGTASGVYGNSVYIAGTSATSAQILDLKPGTWYFIVAAVDADGNESSLDIELSKTIS